MDNKILINSVIRYVETNVKAKINYDDMEKMLGASYRYIREEFKKYTNIFLGRYIVQRKIANAAFDMQNTESNLLALATEYDFDSYDTFTRAFKRETGKTPSEYKKHNNVKRGMIAMGTYAPVFDEERHIDDSVVNESGKVILYGVPKLEFPTGKCTPFAACLDSLLTYIGKGSADLYSKIMAASGAGIRICWNAGEWDFANPRLENISQVDPLIPYRRGFESAGYEMSIQNKEDSSKEEFKKIIIANIDRGNPVIATGIVGPPEASLITGYEDDVETLYGWSFFQDNPELAGRIKIGKTGYFIADDWWDNADKIMSLEGKREPLEDKDILKFMLEIMTKEKSGDYAMGQNAY